MRIVAAHGLAAVGDFEMVEERQDEAVEHCDNERGGFAGELQAVFAERGIASPVVAVLDVPVLLQPVEHLLW